MSERTPRVEIPVAELVGAMDAELLQQTEAQIYASQHAAKEQARQDAAEQAKHAAEVARAWRNPTVTAKFREREAGLVADAAEVRDVIGKSQDSLARMERRQPSNALEAEGRVDTEAVLGIRGKIVHDTRGGFTREFAKGAATDTQHYTASARKARQELSRSVNHASSEKNILRRIGTLKKELAKAQDNQEDFRSRMLEEKLEIAREELIVQRALSAERKAAEAKKATEAHRKAVKKGVKALEIDEEKRAGESELDRDSVDSGVLTVLDGLNGRKPKKEAHKTSASETPGDTTQATGAETSTEEPPKNEVIEGEIIEEEPSTPPRSEEPPKNEVIEGEIIEEEPSTPPRSEPPIIDTETIDDTDRAAGLDSEGSFDESGVEGLDDIQDEEPSDTGDTETLAERLAREAAEREAAELDAAKAAAARAAARERALKTQEAARRVDPSEIRLSRGRKLAAKVLGTLGYQLVNNAKYSPEKVEQRMREKLARKATAAKPRTFTPETVPPNMQWMAAMRPGERILQRTSRVGERSNSRRVVAGVAAGALAIGALGAGGKYLFDELGGRASAQTQTGLVNPPKGPALVEAPGKNQAPVTDTLKKGETVMGSVREQVARLGITMDQGALEAFLKQETSDVMTLNAWDAAAVRRLPIGQVVKLQSDAQMLEDAKKFYEEWRKNNK